MPKRGLRLAAVFGAVLVIAAACSSGADDGSTDAEDSTDVTVTMTEFAFDMSRTDFEAGVEYTFTVTNDGAVPHEMMFVPPVARDERPSMEELDDMAIAVFSADDLPSGATVTQKVTFPSTGTDGIEAACYIPGHYEAGMKLQLTVSG